MLDIFFHYGIIGFIIYFGPLIYIAYRTIRSIFKNKFRLSFFKLTNIYVIGIITVISMIAGHVYSAPAVSIYVSFAMAMLDSALTKGELEITENREKKKITILLFIMIKMKRLLIKNYYTTLYKISLELY